MTRAEWEAIAIALDHLWPGDFTEDDSAAWFLVMGQYPARPIEQAVAQLAGSDQWRPYPAKLIATAGLLQKSRRRDSWQQHFTALEYTYGRAAAIEQLDQEGNLEAHYPSGLPVGQTYFTRRQRNEVTR